MSNRLKLKVRTKLPAALLEGTGVGITKEGLAYTIGLDYSGIEETTTFDPNFVEVAVWNPSTGVWSRVSLTNFFNTSSLFLQSGTGAVSRTTQNRGRDVVSVKDFGAKGDGLTDDTTAIQNAMNYTSPIGKALFFPAGTYLSGTLTALPQMCLVGESPLTSIIKLKNATNNFLIWSGVSHAVDDVILSNIGFDGNSANNTAANMITIYGSHHTFENLHIANSSSTALTTISDPFIYDGNMTSRFFNITIDKSQGTGWNFAGPNDSEFDGIFIIDAGLAADNTYAAFTANGNGNGYFNNYHAWNRSTSTNTPTTSMSLTTNGNKFTNSTFEGSHTPLSITGTGNNVVGCSYYAPRGSFCVDLAAGGNTVSGLMGIAAFAGNTSYKGINIRSSNNIVDVYDAGCLNGAIDFSSDAGQNFVRLNGFRASGTAIVGTPAASDDVMIAIGGAAGMTLSQRPGLAWTAYTPTIASGAGTITTLGTVTARYQLTGKQVAIEIDIPITTIGSATGSITATLPFTAQSSAVLAGRETGVSGKMLQGYMVAGSTVVTILNYDNTGAGASGARIIVSGVYERQ